MEPLRLVQQEVRGCQGLDDTSTCDSHKRLHPSLDSPLAQVESSLAFYDKVVDIWYKFLASVRNDSSLAEDIEEAQLSEGMDMLLRVLNTRVNLLGDTHIATVS